MSNTNALPYPVSNGSANRPMSRRINARLIAFLGTIVIVVGSIVYFAWPAIALALGGGIREGRDGKIVDLRALGYFAIDPKDGTLNNVPKRFRELDGQHVVLDGFMFGGDSVYEPRDYQFVYNIQNCCFNGPPLVQERVFVHVPEGMHGSVFLFQPVRTAGRRFAREGGKEDGDH